MASRYAFRMAAIAAAIPAVIGLGAPTASAQVDPYIGQMMLTAASYCPRGTFEANGQIVAIQSNTALFSLVGVTYGGDGRTVFALPDLRGRVPIALGQGPGLPSYAQGQIGGTVSTTLTAQNLPAHTHGATATLNASGQNASGNDPTGASLAASTGGSIYRTGDDRSGTRSGFRPGHGGERRQWSVVRQSHAVSDAPLVHRHDRHLSAS